MRLEMTHNGKFGQKSGLDWVKMAIFAYFSMFSPKMRLRLTRSGQFHLIPNFSNLLPPRCLIFGEIPKIFISAGGTSAIFFWVFQLFQIVWHQCSWKWPTMENLAKTWLRLGQNSHFCIFFYLFPQNEAEITQNGQFHLIPNFSHLLPTKHLIFGEIPKIFISGVGGVHRQIFWVFQLFQIVWHHAAGNDPQWQIWPKKWLRLGQNGHFCIFFYLFPQNEAEINSEWSISLTHNFSHLLPTKHLIFGEISKIFISWAGTSANFLNFPTFSTHLTPMWLEITHNGKFGQKSGLDWVKMAIFAYFSIFSPKMRLRLTRNGQFHLIPNFSHLLPPRCLIFGEIPKIFISAGGTSAIFFWVFHIFQIVWHQCGWKWPTMENLAKNMA